MVDYTPHQKAQLDLANRRIHEYQINLRISFFKNALRVIFFPFFFVYQFLMLILCFLYDFWKHILFFCLLFISFAFGGGDISFFLIFFIVFLIGSGGRF